MFNFFVSSVAVSRECQSVIFSYFCSNSYWLLSSLSCCLKLMYFSAPSGTKTTMVSLKVKADGTVVEQGKEVEGDTFVLSRHYETNKAKKENDTARAESIQNLAESLFAHGPGKPESLYFIIIGFCS